MNRKGFAPIIILLIVAVILIGAGIWYYETHTVQSGNPNSPEVGTSSQSSSTSANMASWQQFSDQYISFSYPSNFQTVVYDDSASTSWHWNLSVALDDPNQSASNLGSNIINFYPKTEIIPDTLSAYEAYLLQYFSKNQIIATNRQALTINGANAVMYDIESKSDFQGEANNYGAAVIIDDGDYVVDAEFYSFTSPSDIPTAYAILKSIALKNVPYPSHAESASLDVSTWKTLNFLNISFKYPSDWTVSTATEGLVLTSADRLRGLHISADMPSNFDDFIMKNASSEVQSVQTIKINNLTGKLYQINQLYKDNSFMTFPIGTSTYFLTTQYYDSDPYLNKIINTFTEIP